MWGQREYSPAFWVIMGLISLFLSSILLLGGIIQTSRWMDDRGWENGVLMGVILLGGFGLGVAGLTMMNLRSGRKIAALLGSRGVWVPSLVFCGAAGVAATAMKQWTILTELLLLVVPAAYMVLMVKPAPEDPIARVRALHRQRWFCVLFYLTMGALAEPWKRGEDGWLAWLVVVPLGIGMIWQLRTMTKKLRECEAAMGSIEFSPN